MPLTRTTTLLRAACATVSNCPATVRENDNCWRMLALLDHCSSVDTTGRAAAVLFRSYGCHGPPHPTHHRTFHSPGHVYGYLPTAYHLSAKQFALVWCVPWRFAFARSTTACFTYHYCDVAPAASTNLLWLAAGRCLLGAVHTILIEQPREEQAREDAKAQAPTHSLYLPVCLSSYTPRDASQRRRRSTPSPQRTIQPGYLTPYRPRPLHNRHLGFWQTFWDGRTPPHLPGSAATGRHSLLQAARGLRFHWATLRTVYHTAACGTPRHPPPRPAHAGRSLDRHSSFARHCSFRRWRAALGA